MNKQPWIFLMPEGWVPGRCEVCPHGCKNDDDFPCCTHVEAERLDEVKPQVGALLLEFHTTSIKLGAKLVKLYSAEVKP